MATMGLRSQRLMFALVLGVVLVIPSLALAQAPKGTNGAKAPPTPAKIAEWKKEAEARALFQVEAPLELKLVGDFKVISKDRDTLSTKEYWGEVRLRDAKGKDLKIPVTLRTRAHFRLRNCAFPQLRLDFKKAAVKGTVFDGQDKLKLVTHCNPDALFEEYVVREYLSYRVHNLISPRSYRARLARITYVDSATQATVETRNGIFIEHEDDVAKRMGGEIAEVPHARFADVDQSQLLEVAIFEAFVGNTDWSLIAQHNIRLVRVPNGVLLPVAYDFDFSGLVGTKYAIPSRQLGIRSVQERLYRGPCKDPTEVTTYLGVYQTRRSAILKLYDDTPGLDPRYRTGAKTFLNQWFDMTPRQAQFLFKDNCKVVPGV